MSEIVLGKWTDFALNNGDNAPVIRPINIKRYDFGDPIYMLPGDSITATIHSQYPEGTQTTPPTKIGVCGKVTHCLKFELIGELGMDMGVGVIFGMEKSNVVHKDVQGVSGG
jgi:hypothetical protein